MSHRSDSADVCQVGYVVHTYPSVSHTFVVREVRGVRKAGGRVETFSIHHARSGDVLSGVDREEAARTDSVLPPQPRRLLGAHVHALLRSPAAYFRTLAYGLSHSPPGLRSRVWQVFYFAEAIVVWSYARRKGIHHLHAHLGNVAADTCWLAGHYGNLAEPDAGWRWSFTMHGPTEFFAVERFNLARKVAAADLVICISDFCRSQLMGISDPVHWAKLRVVHCGVDLDRYPYRLPDTDGLAVLCVGRLVPEKGQVLLLQAVEKLVRDGVDVRLTLVGGGPRLASLEAEAGRLGILDRVSFPGPVSQDEMPAMFASHNVFCLPSFAEGVPVALMEAMAAGLPVVTTRVAGIPELVEDGITGLLVPPGRADAVGDALRKLADDPSLAARLSRQGRQAVEASFDAEVAAQQLAVAFAHLENSSGRPAGPGSSRSRSSIRSSTPAS